MSTCPRCGAELPASQANSVDVIAATVLAVDEGANTCALIAEALGYVYGQGVYYGNAAEELGFTTKVQEVPHLWALTTDGEEFLAADRLLRVDILTKKIRSNPNVQRVAAGLPIECGACTGTTVEQRTGSYEACSNRRRTVPTGANGPKRLGTSWSGCRACFRFMPSF